MAWPLNRWRNKSKLKEIEDLMSNRHGIAGRINDEIWNFSATTILENFADP
jgi:hypothetical protein